MSNSILVLGSRYGVKLPDINFKKIYSANGAAELVKAYNKKFDNIDHTSVFGVREFISNTSVREKIINSNPTRLVIRNGKLNLNNYNFNNKIIVNQFSSFDDLKMQISSLNLSIFGFIYSELKYNENNKISYFLKCLKKGFFQGFTSGLFAALLALNENPKSEIIISGIGLEEGGGHFYTSKDHAGFFSQNDLLNKVNKFRNTNRKKVEAYLFEYLKENIKKRMLSTDKDFCKLGNIKYFDCSIIA